MRWFTSDLHLGHRNIIKYCQRPFAHAGAMDDAIVAALARTVTPADELWILGDLAMGSIPAALPRLRAIAARRIVLVSGNHDRCHPMHPAGTTWLPRYEEAGLHVVNGNTELVIGGHPVQISHFPYPAGSETSNGAIDSRPQRTGSDRYASWRPVDDGRWLLCGHVHEKWRQRGRSINVGVDAWAGQPVSEEALAQLIAAGPADRAPLPWKAHSTA